MKPISLIFPYPKKKKKIKRKIIKYHNDYTAFELEQMDDPQLEYLYEHGTPAEKEISMAILRNRKLWDTIMNKSLDDPLPNGSGQHVTGSPTAPYAGSGK